ncbi:MAG TPA: hypothetical protein VMW52_10080, partial [Phycisphaerae bacterium]|nr:hypothetical protein [Phycisphaerae bacterium]
CFASAGDELLVLCQYGAWRIVRVGDGVSYGYASEPLSLGCVSRATVATSPYGTWWLAREGVVLWDGQTLPELALRNQLDPKDSNTTFYTTDLSTACGAFHVGRSQYIVCVPETASTQFLLCVQADMPRRNGYVWSKWTSGLATLIDGMGYDPNTDEVMYHTASAGGTFSAKNATYQDKVSSPASYAFGFDAWWARGERPDVLSNQNVLLTAYRASVAASQTITLNVRAAPILDASAGTTTGDMTLTLGVSARQIVGNLCGLSGEAWRVSVRNTDAYHLALLALSIGPPGRRGA